MKKSLRYFIAVLFMGAFALSCTKLENTPSFPVSSGEFTVAAGSATVAAAPTDSLKKVLTFSWNDPKFAVGLAHTNFTIMVDSAGNGFKSFVTKTFSDTLGAYLLGKELNAFAVKLRSGGSVDEQITLEAKVIAATPNNAQVKTSNIVTFTVTPYGDLALSDTHNGTVVCTAATATEKGDTLNWSQAFVGYTGVKTYVLQYAKGGTSFASPTTVSVTGYSKIYTKRELNQMAEAVGVAANSTGDVDFRIKATNETGAVTYSNTLTVSVSTYVAFNSLGIIGAFTGWGDDVDLRRPDPNGAPGDWTVTMYLPTGDVKFRADDGWNDNWGNSAFPSGTGLPGGSNITVGTAGWYTVNFSTATFAYSFTLLSPATYTNISLIGDFNGWSADVDLTADGTGHIWTGTVSLGAATGLKVRADHAWTTAWGGLTGSSGFASTSGGNINVAAGNYFVYFNDVSGELFIGSTTNNSTAGTPYGKIGAIGDFNGWGADALLIKNPSNPYKWSGKITFSTTGGVKLRADQAWTTSWGGAALVGQGTTQGDPNIPVPTGTYQINFNALTGEYSFEQ